MTDPTMADHVYLKPLNTHSIREILQAHSIDAVLPTMGGQTALNLCKEAAEQGIWEEFGVEIIGVDIAAIDRTEDREQFRQLMVELDIPVATSRIANSYLEGKEAAQQIGYPLVIRPSFTLGGSGGGFVHSKDQLDAALRRGLDFSPIHEVLVEKAVLGWKEYELELLRDSNDNVVIICVIENLDPMGVHTGDSITVAPAMTLSDTAYQHMRNMSIKMMRALGSFAGGCNVQFALNPHDEAIIAIEINPRVSRSSALASKATGYPIAKIAAKLAVGYHLNELKNPVTKTTSAYFEPVQDYVITKIPRWNFAKFPGSDTRLGLQMKSVGEVMGIGRSFNESLQKACQSLEIDRNGLESLSHELTRLDELKRSLMEPSWNRIFFIKEAMSLGMTMKSIQKLTKIDRWFLLQIQQLVKLEAETKRYTADTIGRDLMLELKRNGFSDIQIAKLVGSTEDDIYALRKRMDLLRRYKTVDTCSAEFPSPTNYFYSTFDDENESEVSDRQKIVVLGSGPNRIGQGIEFDYCCVHGIMAIKESGFEAIMINCNPETVSTDFDISDKLYFEPVYWEHIREILDHEKPYGVIVQLGGQTALKLAETFDKYGVRILGTSFRDMDLAEDRGAFSTLLAQLEIPYPRFGVATNPDEAIKVANEVGYPVLVRPSYVLGGQNMSIVINDEELEEAVVRLFREIPGNKLLIDHFLDRAFEAETDSLCDGEEVHIMGVMEHIEPAGIHSGDSFAVLPPYDFSPRIIDLLKEYSVKIARALKVLGVVNVQFAIKNDQVFVIEANPRASRSMPFICKAYKKPYLNYATKLMLGGNRLSDFDLTPIEEGFAIKEPVFSFDKFPNVNKELGPEMKSTGEAIRFISDTRDPYFRELYKKKSMFLSK